MSRPHEDRGGAARAASRSRAARALVCAVVWVLGVEILPAAHIAGHDALEAHDHRGDARALDAYAVLHAHGHADGAGSEHWADQLWRSEARAHARAHRRERSAPHDDEADSAGGSEGPSADHAHPQPDHAAGSLAHHTLALATPPDPIIALPLGPLVAEVVAPITDAAPLAPMHSSPPTARGPPR